MKLSPYLLLALPLFGTACSKDSPVGPSTPSPAPVTATGVIGTPGGQLSCEGFTMLVPPSAFAKSETLTVTQEVYSGVFGQLNVSNEFRLEGLPSDFSGQIRLSLKCARSPSTGLFVGVGNEGTDMRTGDSRTLYELLPAVQDSGRVNVSFTSGNLVNAPGKRSGTRGNGVDLAKWFCAFDQLDTLKSSQGHFKVIHPKSSVGMAVAVAGTLEDAYAWFDQNGFNRGTYALARWPMTVLIARSKEFYANDLVSTSFLWKSLYVPDTPNVVLSCNENEWDHGEPEFRKWLFANFCMLFCTVHDEFFHSRSNYDRMLEHPDAPRLWPYSAIAVWAGGNAHLPGSDSLPPYLTGAMLAPLRGLPLPIWTYPVKHGDGLAGLMKHLADTYGVRLLADIYHTLPAATNEIDVLMEKIPDPEYIWWPAFLKRYIAGEIYEIPADTLLRDLQAGPGSREYTIDERTDTLKYFSDKFPDLSAKLYRVNLRYQNIASNATITFEVGPPTLNLYYVHVMLFGLKNNKLEYWETANKVKVSKVKDLTAAGYDIVAAVVNSANERPYTGTMAIDLDVRVEADVVTSARIKVRTSGVTGWYDGTYTPTDFVLYNSSNTFREGRIIGNAFTATWDDATTLVRKSGTWNITIDFSATPVKVTYFKAEEMSVSSTETETWKVEASNTCAIAGGADQLGSYVFLVRGTEVSKHILPVRNRLEATNGYWRELSATTFDNDSYIEIILE